MAVEAGGGGGGPYVPSWSDIFADPEDLAHFADLVDGDLQAIKDTWERLESDMRSQPDPNFPGSFDQLVDTSAGYPVVQHNGSGGIYEGREFGDAYYRTVAALKMLMDDVIRGYETLRDGARMIHDGYVTSDTANAGGLEGGFAAYERSAVMEALGRPDRDREGTEQA